MGSRGGVGRGTKDQKFANVFPTQTGLRESFLTEQQGFWPMWQIITLTEELCFYVHYLNNLAVAEATLSTPLNSIIEVYLIGSMGTPLLWALWKNWSITLSVNCCLGSFSTRLGFLNIHFWHNLYLLISYCFHLKTCLYILSRYCLHLLKLREILDLFQGPDKMLPFRLLLGLWARCFSDTLYSSLL